MLRKMFYLVFIALTVQVATQVKFSCSSKTEVVNKIIRISSSQSVPCSKKIRMKQCNVRIGYNGSLMKSVL